MTFALTFNFNFYNISIEKTSLLFILNRVDNRCLFAGRRFDIENVLLCVKEFKIKRQFFSHAKICILTSVDKYKYHSTNLKFSRSFLSTGQYDLHAIFYYHIILLMIFDMALFSARYIYDFHITRNTRCIIMWNMKMGNCLI